MAAQFGLSGTIYDAPPAHPEIFRAGAADLNVPLGSGFQAAHLWVNNQSNLSLWIEDAPDVVPPGATRVLPLRNTDVAKASWTVPSQFAIVQPANPKGAAILVWLHGAIDISPSPGIANQPIAGIAGWSLVASKTLAVGADSLTTLVVPSTTKALGLLVGGGGAVTGCTVTGVQTGANYSSVTARVVRQWFMVPVNGNADTSYLITFTIGNGNPVFVYATDVAVLTETPGQTTMSGSLPVAIASDQNFPVLAVGITTGSFNGGPGTHEIAFGSISRAVGTYTTDSQFINGTSGVIMWCTVSAGAGTATFSILSRDPTTTVASSLLASVALSNGAAIMMRVHDGLTAAANAIAQDVVGATPRYQLVIATAAATASAGVDRIP